MLAHVGNQNGNMVNENVQMNVRNVLVNGNRKIENVQDMSGCSIDQKVKYTAGSFVEEFCPRNEMQKLETKLWNHDMVGAGHIAYTDRFHKSARLVPHLVTLESRKIERDGSIKKVEKRGNMGEPSKDKNDRDDNKRTRTGNDCRGMPRNVNPVNARNPPVRACYKCGSTDHVGSKGSSSRSEHCDGLEIEGHVFDIDLIPFGHGCFNVIIDGQVLRVLGERPKEKVILLMSIKTSDKKQEEIVVVRDFPEVFLDDLSCLSPVQEIKFRIELTPGATPVAKSPYHLAPSELEELS
uniref:Reverse transcriptase domain-containing protein n=1 Tax=Tanacetum cinerariifolium TaxID=118510 RepID=A0A6L2P164_TANCI|nr:reverse transcriptase domain-containing protein [Tanacetum cinerariifolium]